MPSRVLFASRSEEWETPQAVFDRLDAVFDFELDAAATPENAKCARYFTKADDALALDWSPYRRIWLNPPYGRGVARWMAKARAEALKNRLIVCLVPARTDTAWWHEHVHGRALTSFVRGRLKFSHPGRCLKGGGSAAFPSALVVYGLDFDRILEGAGSGGGGACGAAPHIERGGGPDLRRARQCVRRAP